MNHGCEDCLKRFPTEEALRLHKAAVSLWQLNYLLVLYKTAWIAAKDERTVTFRPRTESKAYIKRQSAPRAIKSFIIARKRPLPKERRKYLRLWTTWKCKLQPNQLGLKYLRKSSTKKWLKAVWGVRPNKPANVATLITAGRRCLQAIAWPVSRRQLQIQEPWRWTTADERTLANGLIR